MLDHTSCNIWKAPSSHKQTLIMALLPVFVLTKQYYAEYNYIHLFTYCQADSAHKSETCVAEHNQEQCQLKDQHTQGTEKLKIFIWSTNMMIPREVKGQLNLFLRFKLVAITRSTEPVSVQ